MAARWKSCDGCRRWFPADKLTKVINEGKEQFFCEACKKNIAVE